MQLDERRLALPQLPVVQVVDRRAQNDRQRRVRVGRRALFQRSPDEEAEQRQRNTEPGEERVGGGQSSGDAPVVERETHMSTVWRHTRSVGK